MKLSEDCHFVMDNVKAISFKADKNEEEIAKQDEKIEDILNEIDNLRN